jgi:hypothetical protein
MSDISNLISAWIFPVPFCSRLATAVLEQSQSRVKSDETKSTRRSLWKNERDLEITESGPMACVGAGSAIAGTLAGLT